MTSGVAQHSEALCNPVRLAALRATRLLDTPAELEFDRYARVARRLCKAAAAFVALVDAERVFFKSVVTRGGSVGAPDGATALVPREVPLAYSCCPHVVATGASLAVDDVRADSRFADRRTIGSVTIAAYAGVPLLVDGQALGALCVIDTAPHAWSAEDLSALTDLAAGVVTEIQLRAHAKRLGNAEAAFQAHRETLQLAMAAGRISSFEWDIDQDHVTWSENLEALLGMSPGTFGGTFDAFMALVHSEDRDRVVAALERALQDEDEYCCEFRMVRPDGTLRWTETRAVVERDRQGVARRLIGVDVDVTARKAAEAALAAGEMRRQLALDAADAGTWSWEVASRTSTWDERTHAHYGFGPEEPPSFEAWLGRLHPDDRARLLALIDELSEPGGPDTWRQEFRALHPTQGERWMQGVGRVERGPDGRALRLNGINLDITESKRSETARRASEAHLNLAMQASGSMSFEWDIERDRVRRLRSAEPAYPETGDAFDTFENVVQVVHPEDRTLFRANVGAALAREDGAYASEHRILGPDGAVRWLKESGRVNFDADRRPIRLLGISHDDTEHKQIEQRLREGEERLHLALVAAKAGAWGYDLVRDQPHWSSEMFDLYGLDPAAGAPSLAQFAELIAAEDRAATAAAIDAAATRGGPFRIAFRVARKDGAESWIETVGVVEHDRDGKPVWARGIDFDVTEHKRTETALRESEEFNRNILESSADCIKVIDLDGTLIAMNVPGLCLMEIDDFGALKGKPWRSFWPDPSPVDAAVAAAKDGGIGRFSAFCPTAKGTPKWWDVIVSPVRNHKGRVVRLVSTSRDITERKQAEEALRESRELFRTLAAVAPVGIFRTDARGEYRYVNERWCEMAGLAPEAAQGTGWMQAVAAADRAALHTEWAHATQSGREFAAEYRFEHPNGSIVWVFGQTAPERDARGAIAGYVGTVTDISERKAAEEALQRHAEELREADRRKDEFLAILGHELRNPLAPIRNAVQLLDATKSRDPIVAKAQAVIDRQSAQLARLVDDLLDVSRITTGKIVLHRSVLDARAVVEAGVETVRAQADAKRHRLCVELPAPGALTVYGDFARLTQVIGNVVSNAVKYTPDGGTIEVTLRRARNDALEIVVADNGVGLDAKVLPHVFDLFMQVDGSLKRSAGGLGIGLAVVRKLVELHGGSVSAASEGPGRGACFTIRLPVAATSSAAEVIVAENIAPVCRRVLVVDDNRDAAESLALLLGLEGHDVAVCHDGESARDRAHAERFDAILLDLGLPGMDGYATAQAIRAKGASRFAALIAVTGHGQPEDRARTAKMGFDAHLVKPIDALALRAHLSTEDLSVEARLLARIANASLQRFFSTWHELRGVGRWPAFAALIAATAELQAHRVVVEVEAQQPLAMRFIAIGAELAALLPQSLLGRRLEDSDLESGLLEAAYRRVALTGEPSLEDAEYLFGRDEGFRFQRLIVPAGVDTLAEQPTHLVAVVLFQPVPSATA